SQIYVEYVAHQIPIHPVEEFLEPGEPVAQFLKRTGGFRIELRAGESAYHHDSTGAHSLVLVERGLVQLFLVREGSRCLVKQVEPGSVFGEAPMLGTYTFGAEAVAAQGSVIFLIDSQMAEEIVRQSPGLAGRWLAKLSDWASSAEMQSRLIAFGVLETRLAALLLEIAAGSGVSNVSQAEMARRLGVHREAVSAGLAGLKQRGLVEVKRRAIELLNREELNRMVAPFAASDKP
ncbi:MAG: Crp/Fnr family transcriptional regulator, partial [Blastocatellia bacterium]